MGPTNVFESLANSQPAKLSHPLRKDVSPPNSACYITRAFHPFYVGPPTPPFRASLLLCVSSRVIATSTSLTAPLALPPHARPMIEHRTREFERGSFSARTWRALLARFYVRAACGHRFISVTRAHTRTRTRSPYELMYPPNFCSVSV